MNLKTGWSAPFFTCVFFAFLVSFSLPLSSKAVNNIFYIGLALPTLVWMLLHARELPDVFRRHGVLMLMLVGLFALSLVVDTAATKKFLYVFLYFFACLLLIRRPDNARLMFGAYSLVVCLVFIYLTVCWIGQFQVAGVWGRQVFFGAASNPVYASLLIASALVFIWLFYLEAFLIRRSRVQFYVGFFLLVCACLTCVLVFQARSALLGVLLFFVVYLVQRRFLLLGCLTALGAGALLYLSGVGYLLLDRGVSFRTAIWEDALRHLVSSCSVWVGCGADEYRFLGLFMHPHSAYVSTAYRFGIIGAGLFVLFALMFFWRGWKSKSPWFLLALIGWGGVVTTGSGLFSSPQPFWVYFWFPTFMTLLDAASHTASGREGLKQNVSSA